MRSDGKVDSDSVLSALILGIAALALAAFEAGAGAVARAFRDGTAREDALALVAGLPGGPAASLRCVSAIAGAAIIAVASAEAGAGWGLEWGIIMLVGALALAAVAGVSFGARAFGARFVRAISPAACRAAWLLSFPFSPALRVHERLSARREEEGGVVVEFQDEPFDEYELDMIRGVVQLDKTVSEDIMTQRGDMSVANASATLHELADIMVTAGHSRIPVCEEDNIDKIVGVAHARDLLPILAGGENHRGKTAGDIARRSPLFIPEYKTLEDLLKEFQETRNHMALVVDEYGGVSGIVTIEDLLEEIVGEIRDEFDEGERLPEMVPNGESGYLVDADLPLDDFSRELGVEIVGNGFKTVGGLVIHKLGKIPIAGDKVECDGLTIEVESAARRRPYKLKVEREEGAGADAE